MKNFNKNLEIQARTNAYPSEEHMAVLDAKYTSELSEQLKINAANESALEDKKDEMLKIQNKRELFKLLNKEAELHRVSTINDLLKARTDPIDYNDDIDSIEKKNEGSEGFLLSQIQKSKQIKINVNV